MTRKIVHRSKLFGGRETAQQVHAELAWHGQKCSACGAPPAMRVQIFVALADMEQKLRASVQFEIGMGRLNTVQLSNGPAVRTSCMLACSRCAPALERAAARSAPSYAFVDIDRGPGPDNPVVGVLAALH